MIQHASPAIVIVAYNRAHSLRRMFSALERAQFPAFSVPLIVSIDKGGADSVLQEAEGFVWRHGPKVILAHDKHMGLKEHVLACGDLTREHGSIILLEDDIYPSPYFYSFASAALAHYEADARIAGISLYGTRINETAFMGFTPLQDGTDAYFLRVPSSWGQAWSASQWQAFRRWLAECPERDFSGLVPPNVRLWPETSWKKLFCAYMNDTGKFFVYPYQSLTTNFSDIGENHLTRSTRFQVPLQMYPKEYVLPGLDESLCVYDEYCELLPDRLLKLCPHLGCAASDITLDLYGVRDLEKTPSTELILTLRAAGAWKASWARSLKPHEMNLIADIPGDTFKLCLLESCEPAPRKIALDAVCYHYNVAQRVLVWCKPQLENIHAPKT